MNPPEQLRTRWKEFQAHASFSAEQTEIASEVLDTPMGALQCKRYTVTDGPTSDTYWFAMDKPGMPVKVETVGPGGGTAARGHQDLESDATSDIDAGMSKHGSNASSTAPARESVTAATSKGWLAATTSWRVLYGYFGAFGGAKWGGSHGFDSWKEDPRGVAFSINEVGPVDLCIFIPKTISPQALQGILASKLNAEAIAEGDESEARGLGYMQGPLPSSVVGPFSVSCDSDQILVTGQKEESFAVDWANVKEFWEGEMPYPDFFPHRSGRAVVLILDRDYHHGHDLVVHPDNTADWLNELNRRQVPKLP